jgi:hypothetical protein
MIISLLVTGQPKKKPIISLPVLITCPPPQKKYQLTRYSLLSI